MCWTGEKGGYIPYRDSKLTRLLQPSLGGNAKITIICTVTGALMSSDETHNTLKFANRAKRMKNHAAINEVSNEKVGFVFVSYHYYMIKPFWWSSVAQKPKPGSNSK